MHLSLDDLIFDIKYLPLLTLSVFLPKEYGNFNTF